MNISAVIKNIRNIMRQDKGINGDAQRIEQLGWMLFLKIFDAKDQELEVLDDTGDYVSPVPENLKWRNWAEDDEGSTGDELIKFIDQDLFQTLSQLTGDGKRHAIIRDVFAGNNNYMKSGQLFRQVVNELNKINFDATKDKQIFGQVYETILQELQNAGKSGEFYTPRALTEFIADRIKPQIGEKILDPASGTGGFLTACIEYMRKSGVDTIEERHKLQNNIKGMELKPLPHLLAVTNLILHDIEAPEIIYEDALLNIKNINKKTRVDAIVANPPFGGNVDDETAKTYPVKYQTKESADLFLVMMVDYLKKNGRAGIVLPDGSLTGDGVKARIREKLLQECRLHTIIRLPNSVFKPYAQVSTNLLFFEKIKNPSDESSDFATKEIWYYQHNLPKTQKSYNKTKPIKVEEFEPIKKWWDNRKESELAWKVDFTKVLEDAKTKAKPHFENSEKAIKEASKIKRKIADNKSKLKKDFLNFKDLGSLKLKIAKLEKQQSEAETKAKIEKQTAESIYYSAFELDIKNPFIEAQENLDPKVLLNKLNTLDAEITNLQNDLINELQNAI